MREAEEPLGAPVTTQRIEQDAKRAVEHEIRPEGRAACGEPRLDAREDMAAGERDQHESECLVELHRMPGPTVTAAGEKAPDATDRVANRHGHGEVVRAARELQPTESSEYGTRKRCPQKSPEEDKPDREVGPEAELAARVVLPAERSEQCFRADDGPGEHRPHGRPELVLGDPDAAAVAFEPEHGNDAPRGG